MSEDRILRRRNVGPYLKKDLLREKMTPEDAQKELSVIRSLIEEVADHERSIENFELALHTYVVKYNLGGLNNLLAFLTNKSGLKINKKKKEEIKQ